MKRFLFVWLLVACATGAELPVLRDTRQAFRFVVLGDVHYTRPQFAVSNVIARIAESVRDSQPPVAFVCQTGDIAEGGGYTVQDGKRVFRRATPDDMREELAFAVRDVTERFGCPLFIAVGNHDKHDGGKAVAEVVWPAISRQLGVTVAQDCYGFRHGNSCFVFLDFAPRDYLGQQQLVLKWLEEARSAQCRHIFLFAHYPLWVLVRPGFSSQRFTESVLPVFRRFPVDAFFCGHTHNTSAGVRRFDGATITQLQGVACQASRGLIPMEEARTLLVPRSELEYYWGYLSGPAAGFFLVTVDGDRVQVQFRSGAKTIREFEWRQPGRITDLSKPPVPAKAKVTETMLQQARAAALVICPWAEERAEVGVVLNGERVATFELGPTPRSNAFASEKRVQLPVSKLRLVNEIVLENPGRAVFAVGHCHIEVRLSDGRVVRSAVSDRFFFSATEAEGKAAGQAYGWGIIPPSLQAVAGLGQPLGPMRLCF
ncbi:MAG: metallophosphoesterase [Verrucomicrobiae bacterium]|nr:metallophosphoesterase [Verrucomicrobiae bacterium]